MKEILGKFWVTHRAELAQVALPVVDVVEDLLSELENAEVQATATRYDKACEALAELRVALRVLASAGISEDAEDTSGPVPDNVLLFPRIYGDRQPVVNETKPAPVADIDDTLESKTTPEPEVSPAGTESNEWSRLYDAYSSILDGNEPPKSTVQWIHEQLNKVTRP